MQAKHHLSSLDTHTLTWATEVFDRQNADAKAFLDTTLYWRTLEPDSATLERIGVLAKTLGRWRRVTSDGLKLLLSVERSS